MQSESVDQLFAALAQAQGMMKNAGFDAVNPHFKSKYATWAAVRNATREALAKHGIAILHTNDWEGDIEYLTSTMGHSSGQWKDSKRRVPAGLKVQEYMAWETYICRRTESKMAGVPADEDDDGNIANAAVNGKGNAKTAHEKYGTTREEMMEHDLDYDENGHPIGTFPPPSQPFDRMSKAMAKPLSARLQDEMRAIESLIILDEWAKKRANDVASMPPDWEIKMHDLLRGKQIALGRK